MGEGRDSGETRVVAGRAGGQHAALKAELGVTGEAIDCGLNHVQPNRLRRTQMHQRHALKAEQRGAWRRLGDRLMAEAEVLALIGEFGTSAPAS